MCSVTHAHPSAVQSRSPIREFRMIPSSLPTADYRELQGHLEDCKRSKRTSANLLAYVLANKLTNTRPTDDVHDCDLVVGGACVTCVTDGNEALAGWLVHHVTAGRDGGVIPVASLLGATLIGMRVGQRAPVQFEDGAVGRLSVKAVAAAI